MGARLLRERLPDLAVRPAIRVEVEVLDPPNAQGQIPAAPPGGPERAHHVEAVHVHLHSLFGMENGNSRKLKIRAQTPRLPSPGDFTN